MYKKVLTAILLTVLTVAQAWAGSDVDGFGGKTWYDYKASSFGGGDGSSGSPYLISTPEQLALLAYQVNEGGQSYSGEYFSITANLSLDKTIGSKVVWVPIGRNNHPFKGIVNGNGNIVSGMTITATSTSYTSYFGLFGTIENGSISSLTVKEASITLTANEHYRGYRYAFAYDKSSRIVSLNIIPEKSATATYQVKYGDVNNTQAGNIAHTIKVNATFDKRKLDFALTYKGIDWNGNVKIDRNLPDGYTRMNAKDLFSIFAN